MWLNGVLRFSRTVIFRPSKVPVDPQLTQFLPRLQLKQGLERAFRSSKYRNLAYIGLTDKVTVLLRDGKWSHF